VRLPPAASPPHEVRVVSAGRSGASRRTAIVVAWHLGVAAAAAVAELDAPVIAGVMAGSWVLVALIEWSASRAERSRNEIPRFEPVPPPEPLPADPSWFVPPVEHTLLEPAADSPTAVVARLPPASHDLDAAKRLATKVAQPLVVIARNEDDPGSLPRLAQQFLDHVIVGLGPIGAAAHLPEVDDVTDQIIGVGVGVLQKIEERRSLGRPCSQMQVGNEDCPIAQFFFCLVHVSPQLGSFDR